MDALMYLTVTRKRAEVCVEDEVEEVNQPNLMSYSST